MITIRVLHLYRLNRRNTTEIKSQKLQVKRIIVNLGRHLYAALSARQLAQPILLLPHTACHTQQTEQTTLHYTTSSLSSSTFPFKHLRQQTKIKKKKKWKNPPKTAIIIITTTTAAATTTTIIKIEKIMIM